MSFFSDRPLCSLSHRRQRHRPFLRSRSLLSLSSNVCLFSIVARHRRGIEKEEEKTSPHLLLLLRGALALGAVAGGLPERVLFRFRARPLLRVGAVLFRGFGDRRLAVLGLLLGHLPEALSPGCGVRLREQDWVSLMREGKRRRRTTRILKKTNRLSSLSLFLEQQRTLVTSLSLSPIAQGN